MQEQTTPAQPDEETAALLAEGLTEDDIAALNADDDGSDVNDDTDSGEGNEADLSATDGKGADEGAETGTEADQGDGKPPKGFVPHQALHSEREEHKQTKQERDDLRAWQREIVERLSQQQQQPEPAEQQEQVVEFDPNDPIGMIKSVHDTLAKMQQSAAERQQTEAQNTERRNHLDLARSQYQEAAKTDPTMVEAYNAVKQSFAAEMRAYGYSEPQIAQQLAQTEYQHIAFALGNGRNVAQYMKELAQARGWKPSAQPAPDPETERKAKADEAAGKIDKIASAQDANKTLSKGGAGEGEVTLETLAKMSGEELERFAQKNPDLFAELAGA